MLIGHVHACRCVAMRECRCATGDPSLHCAQGRDKLTKGYFNCALEYPSSLRAMISRLI